MFDLASLSKIKNGKKRKGEKRIMTATKKRGGQVEKNDVNFHLWKQMDNVVLLKRKKTIYLSICLPYRISLSGCIRNCLQCFVSSRASGCLEGLVWGEIFHYILFYTLKLCECIIIPKEETNKKRNHLHQIVKNQQKFLKKSIGGGFLYQIIKCYETVIV